MHMCKGLSSLWRPNQTLSKCLILVVIPEQACLIQQQQWHHFLSLASGDKTLQTSHLQHPDTLTAAGKAHQGTLSLSDKRREWVKTDGYFLTGAVTNWRCRGPGSNLNCLIVRRGWPLFKQSEWAQCPLLSWSCLVTERGNLKHEAGSSLPPLGSDVLWNSQKPSPELLTPYPLQYLRHRQRQIKLVIWLIKRAAAKSS